MPVFARTCVVALLWLAVTMPAMAAEAVELSASGERERQATLHFGDTLTLHLTLAANEAALVRAASDRINVSIDVNDGTWSYTSDSPASVAGTEYVAFDAAPVARTVVLVVRAAEEEGGDGDVRVSLLDADDPVATVAREWAAMSRDPLKPNDPDALVARIVRLEALRDACPATRDARCLPEANLALGEHYESAGRSDDVVSAFMAAIDGYVAQGAVLGELAARFGFAGRLYYRGEMAEAEAIYAQCSALAQAHGLTFRAATFENYVAVMRQYAGDLDAALAHYDRARSQLGDSKSWLAGRMRDNIGGVHELRGDYAAALVAYQDAIDFAGSDPSHRGLRASALSNLGALRADLGQKQEAIVLLSESLALFRALEYYGDQGRVLSILGYQMQVLRRPQLAEPLLRNAIAVCDKRQNANCSATASRFIARFLESQGRLDEADVAFAEAQRRATAANTYVVAQLAPLLSDFHLSRGNIDAASEAIESLVNNPSIANMTTYEPLIRLGRGRVHAARGQIAEARVQFAAVEASIRMDALDINASQARIELARLDAKEGNWAEVERRANAEIDSTAKARQEFFDPLMRADFLATRQESFELLIDAKLARASAGDDKALREAFNVDERSRSRGLLDALADVDAAARQGDPSLLAARDNLRERQLALRRLSDATPLPDTGRLDALRGEIATARIALEALEARLAGDTRAALGRPHTIDEVQDGLTSESQAVLMYRLRENGSWVWVVTRDDLRRVELPDRSLIAPRVDSFVADLRDGKDADTDGRWLYDTLVGAALLPSTVSQVLVVPDGALQRLPFVALNAPDGRFLVESLQLSMLPSTSVGVVLAAERQRAKTFPVQDVVVFADPVFSRDDPRLGLGSAGAVVANAPAGALDDLLGQQLMRSGSYDTLPRLPGTAREADAMRAAFGEERVRVFEGLDATLDAARGDAARHARILHFATHGLVDSAAPELTGLALSRWQEQGGLADGDGLFNLPLIGGTRFNAELVILSACDSAVGRDIESEGMIGLSRSFLAAGAGSVIATLWPVSDREAARLDRRLATEMEAGANAAAALRAAQNEAIADPQRRRPRNWAAFGFYGPL